MVPDTPSRFTASSFQRCRNSSADPSMAKDFQGHSEAPSNLGSFRMRTHTSQSCACLISYFNSFGQAIQNSYPAPSSHFRRPHLMRYNPGRKGLRKPLYYLMPRACSRVTEAHSSQWPGWTPVGLTLFSIIRPANFTQRLTNA